MDIQLKKNERADTWKKYVFAKYSTGVLQILQVKRVGTPDTRWKTFQEIKYLLAHVTGGRSLIR